MNKEPVYFEVGDTVYHYQFGTGIVGTISENSTYPVWVDFGNKRPHPCFTHDGRLHLNNKSTLSQTPYDLVNGGFTLKPKLPKIEKGTLVYIKIDKEWHMRFFSHFPEDGRGIHTFDCQRKSGLTSLWFIYSLTNPLLEE